MESTRHTFERMICSASLCVASSLSAILCCSPAVGQGQEFAPGQKVATKLDGGGQVKIGDGCFGWVQI